MLLQLLLFLLLMMMLFLFRYCGYFGPLRVSSQLISMLIVNFTLTVAWSCALNTLNTFGWTAPQAAPPEVSLLHMRSVRELWLRTTFCILPSTAFTKITGWKRDTSALNPFVKVSDVFRLIDSGPRHISSTFSWNCSCRIAVLSREHPESYSGQNENEKHLRICKYMQIYLHIRRYCRSCSVRCFSAAVENISLTLCFDAWWW